MRVRRSVQFFLYFGGERRSSEGRTGTRDTQTCTLRAESSHEEELG